MPRTLSIPSQEYPAGYVATQSVNNFTNRNTTALEWTATVENWPTDTSIKLFAVTVTWDTGHSANWVFHGGPYIREDGTAAGTITCSFPVITISDGAGNSVKDDVASGTIKVEVFHPIRTALTLAAI